MTVALGLSAPIPVHFLDQGRLLTAEVKRWWASLLEAQRRELTETLGAYQVVRELEAIARLEAPSVLVVPVIAGGVVGKRDWTRFQELLWQYVRRGGVVVVLRQGFCLAEDGEKAGGRTFEGVSTRADDTWFPGDVTFRRAGYAEPPLALSMGALPDPLPRSMRVPTGNGFWVEHEARDMRVAGPALEELAHVQSGEAIAPLVLRLAYRPHEYPGAVLFMNTWSWMRHQLDTATRSKSARATDRAQAEFCFTVLRAFNREVVQETVAHAAGRARQRAMRLELLCGDRDRLRHAMGGEKDYHRILANDVELLLDVLARHQRDLLVELRAHFARSAPWPEPPHLKGPDKRGRLDILLVSADEDVGRDARSLNAYLAQEGRSPVAWVELEAHALDVAQMRRFTEGMQGLLRAGDYVCAVDRSHDDDVDVRGIRDGVEALGARFLHVQVPEVFDQLEERYIPELHRLQRRRYTIDVIRGLLG